jgi:hypothetical protein
MNYEINVKNSAGKVVYTILPGTFIYHGFGSGKYYDASGFHRPIDCTRQEAQALAVEQGLHFYYVSAGLAESANRG